MAHLKTILFAVAVAIVVASSLTLAAAGEKTHRFLSKIFDGVPTPEAREVEKQAKLAAKVSKAAAVAPVVAANLPSIPVEAPRPALESARTWEEVLRALPRDITGGPDWVKAVHDGTISPRHQLPSDSQPAGPFTLDSLVGGTLAHNKSVLDLNIEIVPPSAPFYKVVFPHSGHTIWLNCSSCHPGIGMLRGSGMQRILAGEYCGKCHGKVSFNPITSCARCHVNLAPQSQEAIAADITKAVSEPLPTSPELIERGKAAYLRACAACHGENGDGKGPLAAALTPKPRNFTVGKFKFRSTNSSSVPLDADLFRTITKGIQGTSMPSFSSLSYEDRFAIVHFIKTFSERFVKQKPAQPITISDPPPLTPELMEMGKKFFREAECFKCHGNEGRGDGPSSVGMKDDWGDPIRPFDFTTGRPKSGSTLKDYYRDVMTGLQGTPMPDFGDTFEPEQAWSVVYYVYSLGNAGRDLPPAVKGDILFTRKAPEGSPTPTPGGGGEPQPQLDPVADHQGQSVPAATFPHWFHRMRVRCSVCHSSIFEMKAGANPITMDAIRGGKFCGKCHPSYPDSKALAWPVAFESCVRCHVSR